MGSYRLIKCYNTFSLSQLDRSPFCLPVAQSTVKTAGGHRPFMFSSEWTAMFLTKTSNSLSKLSRSAVLSKQRQRCHVSSVKVAINANTRASGIPSMETESHHVDQAIR